MWTPVDRRIGIASALIVPSLGAAYLVCGAIGIRARGDGWAGELMPVEPYVSICRVLMLLLTADLVVLFAAMHAFAPATRKIYSLAALSFIIVFAVITSVNTFLLLTVARHVALDPALSVLFSFRWPSVNLALELFAWGPVLGLAMLFAAPVFTGGRMQAAVRVTLCLGGLLCVANVLCFALDDVRFSRLGIAGYDFVLPVACVLIAVVFRRSESRE